MMLVDLLRERGIDRALVIDDGYDNVPIAADIPDEQAWANFIADISVHQAVLDEVFPQNREMNTDDLIRSDEFVAALWGLRGRLDASTWNDLFSSYERDQESDKAFLDSLETQLANVGVATVRAGRSTPITNNDIPLVFIDLFLGAAQSPAAMQQSISKISEWIAGREANPPLVVLMSRSDRLDMNKEEFRRQTKLLGAMFRVSPKRALVDVESLTRLLSRLAQHRDDGQRIASLIQTWDQGLDTARQNFIDKVRKLDLPDYAQIRDLLLAFEGQPLGSYLIDVFDRVLQFEIEANLSMIRAAQEVNKVDLTNYLAPNIAGSPDLQELVFQTIYQNSDRLALTSGAGRVPLAFGDVLLAAAVLDEDRDASGSDVYSVMTPACDLARSQCRGALLVRGSLKRLKWSEWSYQSDGARTPVIILPFDRRYWISWDLKDLHSWSVVDIANNLHPNGPFRPFIRLRESGALELQQKMIADLGRVGQIAPMPATFPVQVELKRVHPDGSWQPVPLGILARDGGVCFVGRDRDSDQNLRLVLSEAACDEIMDFIKSMSADMVPNNAVQALARLKSAENFSIRLDSGLDMTGIKPAYTPITTVRVEEDKEKKEPIAHIARNPIGNPNVQAQKIGVIAIIVSDLPDPLPEHIGIDGSANHHTMETDVGLSS